MHHLNGKPKGAHLSRTQLGPSRIMIWTLYLHLNNTFMFHLYEVAVCMLEMYFEQGQKQYIRLIDFHRYYPQPLSPPSEFWRNAFTLFISCILKSDDLTFSNNIRSLETTNHRSSAQSFWGESNFCWIEIVVLTPSLLKMKYRIFTRFLHYLDQKYKIQFIKFGSNLFAFGIQCWLWLFLVVKLLMRSFLFSIG